MTVFNLERINVGQVGVKPGSLKMVSSDNLVTITTAGYLNNMGSLILPNLQIAPSDVIECLYSYNVTTDTGTLAYLQPSITNGVITLVSLNIPATLTLLNGRIFVGNASNVATGVALSGDATISNAGVMTIANLAITNAKVSASAAIAFSKLATLATGHILAGNGGVVTDVTVSGDATIGATGVVTLANAAVTSAKTSPLLMQYASVAVTAAQFNGMYAAPKLILAAQGANTLIVLHRAVLAMTFVTAAFANGGVVGFQYDSTVHGAGVAASGTEAAADFFASASTSFSFNGVAGNTVGLAPFTTSVNKGLYLSNLTGAFDTGDSTFVCHFWYTVIPTV